MITSSEPHEGKSSVAANLAYCLARSGCKTLLIDTDVYQPALHHYFGLPNELGSRNILFTNVSLENAIQETEFSELSVIANGTLPEHMEELLLNGEQMKKLLAQLAGQYDYVILDTPAFLGLVESMTLSPLVDGVLLVTRLGETRQDSLISTVRQLDKMQAKILGLVVNQTSQVHSADHYHLNNSAHSLFLKIKGRFRRN
jgi:capsular exopolysaccharide synthesis family protein